MATASWHTCTVKKKKKTLLPAELATPHFIGPLFSLFSSCVLSVLKWAAEVDALKNRLTKWSNFVDLSAEIWIEKCRAWIPVDARSDVTSLEMAKTNIHFQITCTYNMHSTSFLNPQITVPVFEPF